jgi:hypothetical protein
MSHAWGHAGGPFAKVHQEFVHEDEPLELRALDPNAYDPRTVESGRRSFVMRALDEQRSLAAFAALLGELSASGADIDVIGTLTRVVRDEARHVDICQRIVERLGGWPDDAPEPAWVKTDPRVPQNLRVLATIVGSLCVGETISVHMIAGVRRHATDPVVAPLLTRLLADESFHSRFGWWWLVQHTLTDDEHHFLARWLPKVLDNLAKTVRPSAEKIARARPFVASPFGSMPVAERAAAFDKAMNETIVPGLGRAGIDARRMWTEIEKEMAS